jgi:hypothetical protein
VHKPTELNRKKKYPALHEKNVAKQLNLFEMEFHSKRDLHAKLKMSQVWKFFGFKFVSINQEIDSDKSIAKPDTHQSSRHDDDDQSAVNCLLLNLIPLGYAFYQLLCNF